MKSTIEQALINKAKDIISNQNIDIIIGYKDGATPFACKPYFINDDKEVDKLVWNSFCDNNLAVYLPGIFREYREKKSDLPKIAIIVKGCDARSVVGLMIENQVPKENVFMIGMPCCGIVDEFKIKKLFNNESVLSCKELDDGMLEFITVEGNKKKVKRESVIADNCLECSQPVSDCVDVQIEGESRKSSNDRYNIVKEYESKSPDKRWEYFKSEISKCIKCYACRQACPNCYCKICFIDQAKPQWSGAGDNISDLIMFHIGRIFHQAGRCVECGACVRACPRGIDLRTFTQKIEMDVEELFKYMPGLSKEAELPLCTFKDNDDEKFITKPEDD